eukprot:6742562-Alexandrium_andersonii.AAC.1
MAPYGSYRLELLIGFQKLQSAELFESPSVLFEEGVQLTAQLLHGVVEALRVVIGGREGHGELCVA